MYAVMDSPLGHIAIEAQNGAIERVYFTTGELLPAREELLLQAQKQLQQYFAGERCVFDLPVRLRGSVFQTAAWEALRRIPYGETRTYGQQAAMMGRATAVRAVGGANHKNPIAIIIPCHRVVAANGMGGYASGMDKKGFLLALEKQSKERMEKQQPLPDAE